MKDDLQHIEQFIEKHHVMHLATYDEGVVSACSVFYVYDSVSLSFVFASAPTTTHIQHIEYNNQVAATIALETDQVGLIQGLQIQGLSKKLEKSELKRLYFKKYPYALALNPTLWCLHVKQFKLTDNRLGFGKKVYYPPL